MEEAAGLAGIAIERERNEVALRTREAAERDKRLLAETLRDTASVLITTLDLNDTMQHILDNVEKVVPHAAASITLLEGDWMRVAAVVGYPEEAVKAILPLKFPADLPTIQQMVETKTALLIPDTTQSTEWRFYPEAAWVRSFLGAPIVVQENVIGFLNLDSDTVGFFRPEHIERLQTFANQAALAIERAELYSQLQAYAAELEQRVTERTLELQQALASEKELSEVRSRFILTVSHEFRTPLAVILSTLEILKQYGDRLTDDQVEAQFKKTETAIQHLSDLMHKE